MVFAPHLRKLLSIAFAGALAACSSAPTAPLQATPESACTVTLMLAKNRVFVLGNANTPEVPGAMQKTIRDEELQALLDTFAIEGTFDHTAADVPPTATQMLLITRGDQRWCLTPAGARDERSAAFTIASNRFLLLFNSVRSYRPADQRGRP